MATDIVMPNLGFDTQSGQIIEWYKQPGDSVEKGEPLALVEADKSNVDLESRASGVLLDILVPMGEDVDVGTVIARIGTEAEYNSSSAPPVAQTTAAAAPTPQVTPISPVAKRLAEANQIDLAAVAGSGVRGRIMRKDIEAHLSTQGGGVPMALPKVRKAAREAGIRLADLGILDRPITLADLDTFQRQEPAPAAETAAAEREGATATSLNRMRQTIGRRLVSSKQAAPHFYVTGEFDLTDALAHLPAHNAKVNDLLQYLTVQALLKVPALNSTFEDEVVYTYDHINLAIAVALDAGLITPVLHKADHFSLRGLAERSRDLVKRTRAGKLQPEEMRGATFTISNLGVIPQVEHFTAIINPPQVAILAVGTVKQRPVMVNGGFHARHTVHMTLSGDHRVVDGMHLGRFMAAYQDALDHFNHERK